VTEQLDTIPITCSRDGQAPDVTNASMAASQHTGCYQALWLQYLMLPAVLAAPGGRPCARCIAVAASRRPEPTTARVVDRGLGTGMGMVADGGG
jgi:hypothetical protein